jgi:CheY-like chemotaxis protein
MQTMGKCLMPHPRTVLVVDDDPSTRALMMTWLEIEGYDVRTASNGSEALALLRREAPSLMIVDLDMPVMDGAELRRQQLLLPAVCAIPFILVSGARNAARIARALGIADVLTKPFGADRLLRIVSLLCHA